MKSDNKIISKNSFIKYKHDIDRKMNKLLLFFIIIVVLLILTINFEIESHEKEHHSITSEIVQLEEIIPKSIMLESDEDYELYKFPKSHTMQIQSNNETTSFDFYNGLIYVEELNDYVRYVSITGEKLSYEMMQMEDFIITFKLYNHMGDILIDNVSLLNKNN